MNIEKLAKHLKEFSLDEIEMIAECDCKTELEQLLNANKIVFEQGVYKYKENLIMRDYGIIIQPTTDRDINFDSAVEHFLKNYAYKFCAKRTADTYKSIFKVNISIFFKNKNLNDITNDNIKDFYTFCKNRNLGARRLQSTLVLLNQFFKYCKSAKLSNTSCNFQVKRLTNKDKIDRNRIIFEGN